MIFYPAVLQVVGQGSAAPVAFPDTPCFGEKIGFLALGQGLLPLFAMCDRWDIGGLSTPYHPDTNSALVFIYDAFPGGMGIAEKGFCNSIALSQACQTSSFRGMPGVVESTVRVMA